MPTFALTATHRWMACASTAGDTQSELSHSSAVRLPVVSVFCSSERPTALTNIDSALPSRTWAADGACAPGPGARGSYSHPRGVRSSCQSTFGKPIRILRTCVGSEHSVLVLRWLICSPKKVEIAAWRSLRI